MGFTLYVPYKKRINKKTGNPIWVPGDLNFRVNTLASFVKEAEQVIRSGVVQIKTKYADQMHQPDIKYVVDMLTNSSKIDSIIHSVRGPSFPKIIMDYLKTTQMDPARLQHMWLTSGDYYALIFSELLSVKSYPKYFKNSRKAVRKKHQFFSYDPTSPKLTGVISDWSILDHCVELAESTTPEKYLVPSFILNTMPEEYSLKRYMGMLHYPNRYRTFEIPKPNGDTRKITTPVTKLRRIQNLMKHSYLDPLWKEIESGKYGVCRAFAYRSGMPYSKFSEEFVGCKMIYHFDLKDFFTSIRVGHVRNCLKTMGVPEYIRYLIAAISSDTLKRLPQGTTVSPVLSNIVGHFLIDIPMQKLADKYKLKYARYADDLNFGGSKVKDELTFRREIIEILRKNRFRLNKKKTKKYPDNQRQLVLNHVVNEKLSIPKWKQHWYRAIIHNCRKSGFINNFEQFQVRHPALMYHQLYWKLQHYALSTRNPKMVRCYNELLEIGEQYKDQISMLVFGTRNLSKLFNATGNFDPEIETLKIYTDGYANKNGSGHTVACPGLQLECCYEHKKAGSNQHAEISGLETGLKIAIAQSGKGRIPELLTDSKWLWTKLMQGKPTGTYGKRIYRLLHTLRTSPNPIIVRHIPREENLSDELKNSEEKIS